MLSFIILQLEYAVTNYVKSGDFRFWLKTGWILKWTKSQHHIMRFADFPPASRKKPRTKYACPERFARSVGRSNLWRENTLRSGPIAKIAGDFVQVRIYLQEYAHMYMYVLYCTYIRIRICTIHKHFAGLTYVAIWITMYVCSAFPPLNYVSERNRYVSV